MAGARRAAVISGAGAAVSLARAGALSPIGARKLRRMAGTQRRLGESLATVAAITAVRHPHRVAIIDEQGELTYADLARRAAALSEGLRTEFGAGPNRSVAVLCRNHRGFIEATLAAGRIGADLLLLNTDFAGPQLADVLRREQPGVLILDEEFLPALGFARADAPPAVVAWHDGEPSGVTLEALAQGEPPRTAPRPLRPGRITILTSGTTGRPKGAQRTVGANAITGTIASIVHRLGLRSNAPMLIGVPLFHGYGLAMAVLSLTLGSPMVLRRRFDPELALADVERHRVQAMTLVPVMLKRLLDLPAEVTDSYDRSSLQVVLSGAAPLDPALADRALTSWGDVLYNGYGSSEAGIAALATPADLRVDRRSVGRPVLGTTVRILDDDHQEVPVNVTGNVYVGGGMVYGGYTGGGGGEAIAAKTVVDGRVSTGDLGHLDSKGRLTIDGREDDMVVSGGENVYPREVEDLLHAHEDIADVAVLGVPDIEFGHRLAAYVVRVDDTDVTAEELRAFVKENLARYKVPRDILFVAELPRTATGKVLKRALREGG